MNILVFGANGQLGSSFRSVANGYIYKFIFVDYPEVDFCDEQSILKCLNKHDFDIIINCAAYTNVDKAENEQNICMQINSIAPEIIAKFAQENKKIFFHISTDYVFDGKTDTPYTEEDRPNPCNFYGKSKLLGEEAILKHNPSGFIIRTSGLVSEFNHNFVKSMIEKMNNNDETSVVTTQVARYTYASDLANVIIRLIGKESWGTTLLHYANAGAMNWYEFATLIKEKINSNCNILSVSNYPQIAIRPNYSVLSTEKIETQYNVNIKDISDAVSRIVSRI